MVWTGRSGAFESEARSRGMDHWRPAVDARTEGPPLEVGLEWVASCRRRSRDEDVRGKGSRRLGRRLLHEFSFLWVKRRARGLPLG